MSDNDISDPPLRVQQAAAAARRRDAMPPARARICARARDKDGNLRSAVTPSRLALEKGDQK